MELLFRPSPMPDGRARRGHVPATTAHVVAQVNARKTALESVKSEKTTLLQAACAAAERAELEDGSGQAYSGTIALLVQEITDLEARILHFTTALLVLDPA